MSERREFNASTVDEAVEKAAAALGAEPGSVAYEVLDEGSSGFLGLGARDARIVAEQSQDSGGSAATQEPPLNEEPDQAEPRNVESDTDPIPENTVTPTEQSGNTGGYSEAEAAPEEFLEEVKDRVETTLDAMTFDHEVSVWDEGEVVAVNIESGDAGLLIGQKGETIDALQYLTNVAVYRNRQFSKKIVLDCEGYRERRVKAVQGMAHRSAKRVAREGVAVDLPPMSSSERRAVHDYLKDAPQVATASAGNDENRHVTISPA